MSNDSGNYNNIDPSSSYSGEPVTNDNDTTLQNELNGQPSSDQAGDNYGYTDSSTWDGMESGAVQRPSTQTDDWLRNVPAQYRNIAKQWAEQKGVVKIVPLEQRQRFTYTTIPYIASKLAEPKTQIFPIVDLQVTPHQINWDFYSTTEGRVGVSNAVEEHMSCEFDVYLTDLIAAYWVYGDDNQYNYKIPIFSDMRKEWWDAVENKTYLDFEKDYESTKEFIDFRNTFLQQHMGWVCRFASHTFGVFQGVINQVNYSIGAGESFAKWHIKIEEAIFLKGAYSTSGKKEDSTTSDGSTTDSGSAADAENIEVGE